MASVATTVKNLIYDKVNALVSVQVVYSHEELAPTGFPAVCIKATGFEGDFVQNTENGRIYSYRIFVHMTIGQDLADVSGDRLDNAEDVVTNVIDQIAGAIDDNFQLDGATVLFVEAVDSDYQYTLLDNGWAQTAVCTVRVHTDYHLPNSSFILDEHGIPIVEE
jgi:hypothetical protein